MVTGGLWRPDALPLYSRNSSSTAAAAAGAALETEDFSGNTPGADRGKSSGTGSLEEADKTGTTLEERKKAKKRRRLSRMGRTVTCLLTLLTLLWLVVIWRWISMPASSPVLQPHATATKDTREAKAAALAEQSAIAPAGQRFTGAETPRERHAAAAGRSGRGDGIQLVHNGGGGVPLVEHQNAFQSAALRDNVAVQNLQVAEQTKVQPSQGAIFDDDYLKDQPLTFHPVPPFPSLPHQQEEQHQQLSQPRLQQGPQHEQAWGYVDGSGDGMAAKQQQERGATGNVASAVQRADDTAAAGGSQKEVLHAKRNAGGTTAASGTKTGGEPAGNEHRKSDIANAAQRQQAQSGNAVDASEEDKVKAPATPTGGIGAAPLAADASRPGMLVNGAAGVQRGRSVYDEKATQRKAAPAVVPWMDSLNAAGAGAQDPSQMLSSLFGQQNGFPSQMLPQNQQNVNPSQILSQLFGQQRGNPLQSLPQLFGQQANNLQPAQILPQLFGQQQGSAGFSGGNGLEGLLHQLQQTLGQVVGQPHRDGSSNKTTRSASSALAKQASGADSVAIETPPAAAQQAAHLLPSTPQVKFAGDEREGKIAGELPSVGSADPIHRNGTGAARQQQGSDSVRAGGKASGDAALRSDSSSSGVSGNKGSSKTAKPWLKDMEQSQNEQQQQQQVGQARVATEVVEPDLDDNEEPQQLSQQQQRSQQSPYTQQAGLQWHKGGGAGESFQPHGNDRENERFGMETPEEDEDEEINANEWPYHQRLQQQQWNQPPQLRQMQPESVSLDRLPAWQQQQWLEQQRLGQQPMQQQAQMQQMTPAQQKEWIVQQEAIKQQQAPSSVDQQNSMRGLPQQLLQNLLLEQQRQTMTPEQQQQWVRQYQASQLQQRRAQQEAPEQLNQRLEQQQRQWQQQHWQQQQQERRAVEQQRQGLMHGVDGELLHKQAQAAAAAAARSGTPILSKEARLAQNWLGANMGGRQNMEDVQQFAGLNNQIQQPRQHQRPLATDDRYGKGAEGSDIEHTNTSRADAARENHGIHPSTAEDDILNNPALLQGTGMEHYIRNGNVGEILNQLRQQPFASPAYGQVSRQTQQQQQQMRGPQQLQAKGQNSQQQQQFAHENPSLGGPTVYSRRVGEGHNGYDLSGDGEEWEGEDQDSSSPAEAVTVKDKGKDATDAAVPAAESPPLKRANAMGNWSDVWNKFMADDGDQQNLEEDDYYDGIPEEEEQGAMKRHGSHDGF